MTQEWGMDTKITDKGYMNKAIIHIRTMIMEQEYHTQQLTMKEIRMQRLRQ